MNSTFLKCPKCGHRRAPEETADPERCPACGLYFAKWLARGTVAEQRASANEGTTSAEPAWKKALRERLNHIPENIAAPHLYGRAVLLAFFLVWGTRLALMDYRSGEIGTSFMHAILLPIHEAGHILFLPFGEFMNILGGSLFQLLLPLIAAGTLLWQNRDPFGTALGIWWCGASMLDLAPYIYDARNPQLMLLGGHTGEDGPHDWIYLLGVFGRIQQSQTYGWLFHKAGVLVMAGALVWAAAVLWRYHQHRVDR
jgi:hypothetical protein